MSLLSLRFFLFFSFSFFLFSSTVYLKCLIDTPDIIPAFAKVRREFSLLYGGGNGIRCAEGRGKSLVYWQYGICTLGMRLGARC